jgi:hypothetical protein
MKLSDWKIDSPRQVALAFVRMKGRMPENEIELADWLLEFDESMWNALNLVIDNYQLHVQSCVGAMELPKGRPS